MQKTRKRFNPGEAIIPILTLAFGVAYFIQTRDASLVAIKWPYIIAILTGAFWLAVVIRFFFDDREPVSKDLQASRDMGKILLILVAPIVYVTTMPFIGFGLGSFIFLTILFRLLGGQSWIRNGLVAFFITAFLYVSMIVLMKMSLPRLVIGSIQI